MEAATTTTATTFAPPISSPSAAHSATRVTPQRTLTVQQPSWKNAVAGACASIFARTATAPIERVKLLMQLQNSLDKSYQNRTAFQVAQDIWRKQGFLSFWRGNIPNILQQAGNSSLNFMLMDYYKSIAAGICTSRESQFTASLLSGGLAGGTATTLLYPIQFLRTRLALDVGSCGQSRMYPNGMRDVLWKTVTSDGLVGLYQGYGIAVVGVFLYRALHLGGYDAVKRELQHRKEDGVVGRLTWIERFGAAQLVSLTAGTLCYPIDSVRRRLMMQAGVLQELREYRSAIHCFQMVWQREGLRGFYLGIGPNVFRSVGAALLLVAYDGIKFMF